MDSNTKNSSLGKIMYDGVLAMSGNTIVYLQG